MDSEIASLGKLRASLETMKVSASGSEVLERDVREAELLLDDILKADSREVPELLEAFAEQIIGLQVDLVKREARRADLKRRRGKP